METVANTEKQIYSDDRAKVSDAESAMKVRDLNVSYDDKTALSKISVRFPKQKIPSFLRTVNLQIQSQKHRMFLRHPPQLPLLLRNLIPLL